MTKTLPKQAWLFSNPNRPRAARVLALWATIVLHIIIVGVMLAAVAPQVFTPSQRLTPAQSPLWDDPPPPPPKPEVVEIVQQQAPPPTLVVPISPPPVPVAVFVPEITEVAVAEPQRMANPNIELPLVSNSVQSEGAGLGQGTDLRSGIDYHCRKPVRYPRTAERNHWQGSVRLRARIAPNGTLAALNLAESSGHSVLDRAAESWLNKCTFSAPALDAGSVERVGEVTVHFVLQ